MITVSSMGNLHTWAGLVDRIFPSDDRWPGENRFLSATRQYAISLIDPAQKFMRKPQRPPVGIDALLNLSSAVPILFFLSSAVLILFFLCCLRSFMDLNFRFLSE